jgi:hypothetical protein
MKKLVFLLGFLAYLFVACEKNSPKSDYLVQNSYEYINELHVKGDFLWVVSSRPQNYFNILPIIPPYYISKISLLDDKILLNKEIPATESFALDRNNEPFLATYDKRILKFNSDLSIEQLFSIPRINLIREMFYDRSDFLWIATSDGGLYFYDGNDTLKFSTTNSILTSNSVPSITIDSESNIWFIQERDLFKIDNNKTLIKDPNQIPIDNPSGIFDLSSDKNNTLFASKWDGNNQRLLKKMSNSAWTIIDPPTSSNNRLVRFLKSDNSGTIWICYSNYPKDVLAYFDTDKWIEISIPLDEIIILDIETYNNKLILGTSKGIFTMSKN